MSKNQDGHQHKDGYSAYLGVKGAALFQKLLEALLRIVYPLHPNTVTLISLLFAIIAASLIACGGVGLLLAAAFVWLNLVFDLLDGILARRKGLASPQGDYLDKVVDRLADIILPVAIGLANPLNPYPGFVCAIALLLSSYLRLFHAQAVAAGKYGYQTFAGRAGVLITMFWILIVQGIASHWGYASFTLFQKPFAILDFWAMAITMITLKSCWSVARDTFAQLANRR
ncbi:CDP-alcohol phosphatidyltransferase family protein [Oligoflexus tunisiensis]|uniref:CDP-alcohol phosphatidyltransferase family protein n=1 Tax=Oligoflexus tunisiensis TaxID=708132 RepID=UPI00114CC728|nr:CDP-alcohol phosphatidyltransferase family protein [Oligoflexus tunisiensis]